MSWSFGKQNDRTPPSRFSIQQVAITSNSATLSVTLLEGLIPIVGALISVQGTQTATSGGAPNFNVIGQALTGVTIDSTTGIGTLTFALTSSNIGTTADSGMALVPQPIIGDTLPPTATAGQQFAAQAQQGGNKQHGLAWTLQVTGSPATLVVNIQGADVDADSEYVNIASNAGTGNQSGSIGNVNSNFYRAQASGTGGTSPTVAVGLKLL